MALSFPWETFLASPSQVQDELSGRFLLPWPFLLHLAFHVLYLLVCPWAGSIFTSDPSSLSLLILHIDYSHDSPTFFLLEGLSASPVFLLLHHMCYYKRIFSLSDLARVRDVPARNQVLITSEHASAYTWLWLIHILGAQRQIQ
jgi:hypothetical protein